MPYLTGYSGPQVVPDGNQVDVTRFDNQGSLTVQQGGPFYQELTRRGYGFVYSQAAAGVNLFPPTASSVITTTNFVTGRRYKIVNVGDTTWTNIGASAATIGVEFVATGAGDGATGTATLMNSTPMIWNMASSNTYFIPTRVTIGFLGSTAIVAGNIGLYYTATPGDSTGAIQVPVSTSPAVNDLGTPINCLIGSGPASNMVFAPAGQILTTAPTYLKTIGFTALANDYLGKNMQMFEADLQGTFILKPNNAMFIGPNAAMASLAVISIQGIELPIPPGSLWRS
jgi:hypothetical protein